MSPIMNRQIEAVRQAMELTTKSDAWQKLLHIFLVSGVANSQHMQAATGLSRGQLDRLLEKFEVECAGLQPPILIFDQGVPKPGQRGKPSRIYLLGDVGAALLRLLGYPDAHACGLKDPVAVAHALAMLTFHQCAAAAGQTVQTDRVLSYGNNRTLRPDHQILLPDGKIMFYEIEQEATSNLLRRIRETIEHRRSFFVSEQSANILPQVRVLFNLEPGKRWKRTKSIWQQVANQLVAEADAEMPFQLLAMPLSEFIAQPEWEPEPSERWEDLAATTDLLAATDVPRSIAPLELDARYRSLYTELLLVQETLSGFLGEGDPCPDFTLLAYALMIFDASYGETGPLRNLVTPHASVTLLGRYLASRPGLTAAVRQALHPQRARMVWNNTNILHAMQRVLNAFMLYHGWSNTGALRASAVISTGWEEHMTGPYVVQVSLGFAILTQNLIPYTARIRSGLAWVLWALFEHAEVLGLGKPDYW